MESCNSTEFKNLKKVAYLSINDKEYADEIEINLGDDYEYKFEMNRLYILKKKPVYPKSYKDCCDVVNASPYVTLVYDRFNGQTYSYDIDNLQIYENLRKLKICRDAYWKIAGEELGLGKPWEFENPSKNWVFTIECAAGCIYKYAGMNILNNHILVFPTVEMRDAFYENFKELIEKCKELL